MYIKVAKAATVLMLLILYILLSEEKKNSAKGVKRLVENLTQALLVGLIINALDYWLKTWSQL